MSTSMERVKAAFKRTFADAVPAYPILGSFTAKLVGRSIREYLTDPRVFADAQARAYEMFDPDIVVMMADLLMEAEAMGTGVAFPEDSLCQITSHVLEDKGKLQSLSVPDPRRDGRMPYYLEACAAIRKVVTDRPVGSTLVGPWAIAASLRGIQELIYDTLDDPEFVHQLMRLTTEVAKAFGTAVVETGVGLSYSEATVSSSVISPKIYREFVHGYHVELINYFKERKVGVTLHVCGLVDPIIEDLITTGANALSIDSFSSLARAVEVNQKRTVLIGNVATALFESGTREEMEQAVKECIDVAAAGSAFILSSGCEVPPTAPVENVHCFMEAARRLGRYK